jgi:hypothetical protein
MTVGQLIILSVLGCIACSVAGFAGSMAFTLAAMPQPEALVTYTLAPTRTPAPTSTPLPTITPIPNWSAYSFAEGKASIWLPASYSGGDTATSSATIMGNLRASTSDEAFISDIEGLIALPEVKFFAFDTNFEQGSKFMYVGIEALDPDLILSMDDYLNRMMDNFASGSERVVERQIVELERFTTGKLVIENKVPTGEGETFVTMAIYLIEIEDTMWFVIFRTGRGEYKDYQPIIEASVNSFWAVP